MSEDKKVYPKKTLVKVTALWQNQGANGTYWKGRTEEGVEFVMYVNGFRKKETDPEFIVYTNMVDEEQKIAKGSRAPVAFGPIVAPTKDK